jgi:hypothetical protein
MKHDKLTFVLMVPGIGVPILAMLGIAAGLIVAPRGSALSDTLAFQLRHQKIWWVVGGIGAISYCAGLVLWLVSVYDDDHFGSWLAINLILMLLAYGTFPLVGPILAAIHGIAILYRATRLRGRHVVGQRSSNITS